MFALSVLAALGHLSQRERQGTLTRCIGRCVGRRGRACGRGGAMHPKGTCFAAWASLPTDGLSRCVRVTSLPPALRATSLTEGGEDVPSLPFFRNPTGCGCRSRGSWPGGASGPRRSPAFYGGHGAAPPGGTAPSSGSRPFRRTGRAPG